MAEETIKTGFLYDEKGNLSSGRLVKLTSIILAGITTLTGLVALIFVDNAELSGYCFKMTGLFLATATGSEVVQKVTGR